LVHQSSLHLLSFFYYPPTTSIYTFPTRRSSDLLKYVPHVPVANGHINEPYNGALDTIESQLIKDIFKTAQFISSDSIWNSQVVQDRKSTRLNSSHVKISYAVFCLKKKKKKIR